MTRNDRLEVRLEYGEAKMCEQVEAIIELHRAVLERAILDLVGKQDSPFSSVTKADRKSAIEWFLANPERKPENSFSLYDCFEVVGAESACRISFLKRVFTAGRVTFEEITEVTSTLFAAVQKDVNMDLVYALFPEYKPRGEAK